MTLPQARLLTMRAIRSRPAFCLIVFCETSIRPRAAIMVQTIGSMAKQTQTLKTKNP